MEGIEVKFEELLKKQGLTDEQVNAILSGMKENKIYTTSLENAEVRYNKLKDDKKDLETQLGKANNTINDLNKLKIDNEELKSKIGNYETEKANYEKALKDAQHPSSPKIDGLIMLITENIINEENRLLCQ